ncbi:hypothetical protein NPIL_502051 [Nephila pilipes]|uniref:Uncharacterized protein n=1 Tax=Nephila pilipes TaxID=299642 RepID=A0A8X6PCI1_NEPPI|nr:hypothetical protein NPIL_502051 [Nephila pilipes]
MDEVRNRYAQTRKKEITLESVRLRERLSSWGVTTKPETQFTPVKSKNRARKNLDSQSAKKPRTDDANCSNRFSTLTIEGTDEITEMEARDTPPMPSPPASPRRTPRPATPPSIPRRKMAPPITIDNVPNAAALLVTEHPASYLACPRNPTNHPPKPKETAPPENKCRRRAVTSTPHQEPRHKPAPELSAENFPPLPSKPGTSKKQQNTSETAIEDSFSVLKSPKCQELYGELKQFVRIANNIPTKAGRMAALFKFIEEDN